MSVVNPHWTYGMVITAEGTVLLWRQTSPVAVSTVRRSRRSGLHLIAYSVVPGSVGVYAVAADIVAELVGHDVASPETVWAFVDQVVPHLIQRGPRGLRAGLLLTWLGIRELAAGGLGGAT